MRRRGPGRALATQPSSSNQPSGRRVALDGVAAQDPVSCRHGIRLVAEVAPPSRGKRARGRRGVAESQLTRTAGVAPPARCERVASASGWPLATPRWTASSPQQPDFWSVNHGQAGAVRSRCACPGAETPQQADPGAADARRVRRGRDCTRMHPRGTSSASRESTDHHERRLFAGDSRMGDPGLEPGTSSLSEKRSNRLS
jgi:hypothetical protein